MKLSVPFLPRSFTTLALLVSGLSLVQDASAASGPVVIPGGTVTNTYVISAPGSYVLGGDRTLNDRTKDAIQINAPDVTLDLGGFTLAHGTGIGGSACLVNIPATENVEIRNGTLANASSWGIRAVQGKALRVSGVRIVSAYIAVATSAPAASFEKCHIVDAGNLGIYATGTGVLITDCMFSDCGTAVDVAKGARIVRSISHGGGTGFKVGQFSTVSDCTVTGASVYGIYSSAATLRNVDVCGNATGVYASYTVILGSRINSNSTANVTANGGYINSAMPSASTNYIY